MEPSQAGGSANTIFTGDGATPAGLLQVLEACGALLTAMVRTTPPSVRSYHVFGAADAEGFAAMGIIETLVHTHDVAEGLHLDWAAPAELCDLALGRLFPHVPVGTTPGSLFYGPPVAQNSQVGRGSPNGAGTAHRAWTTRDYTAGPLTLI